MVSNYRGLMLRVSRNLVFSPLKENLLLVGKRKPVNSCRNLVTQADYEVHSNESLERLYSYFDSFPENYNVSKEYDVSYAMGVLNVFVNPDIGTYVINKQSPNRQIWLSSPLSGPKRYDFINQKWIYQRDKEPLDTLLTREFRKIYETDSIDFSKHI